MLSVTLTSVNVHVIERGARYAYEIRITLGVQGVPNSVHRKVRGGFLFHSPYSALEAGSALVLEQVQDFVRIVRGS